MNTLLRLEKRLAKVEAEAVQLRAEISALKGVPAQVDLPGMPAVRAEPRQLTENEEAHLEFLATRKGRLERLGVPFVDDERNEPAFIAARLSRIRREVGGDENLFHLMSVYMAEDWPARCTPPFPFRAFVADKTWKRYAEALPAQELQ